MEKANTCYECSCYKDSIQNGEIKDFGICHRISDCGGDSYLVTKNKIRCIFKNPWKKLSLEEIELRKQRNLSDYKSMERAFKYAKSTINGWPQWKKDIFNIK